MIPFTQFIREQWTHLPLKVTTKACSGRTYVVTGGNSGLGFETAKRLTSLGAAKVIIGVRNMQAGNKAKLDIESATNTSGIVEVWHLDLARYDSVKDFAKQVVEKLDRINAVVQNAGIAYDKFKIGAEGHEESFQINVMGNLLLAILLLPKLKASGSKFNTLPHLVMVGSEVAYWPSPRAHLDKVKDDPLRKSDDEKLFDKRLRYQYTKFVQALGTRELASLLPVNEGGVVINYCNPGLTRTGLSRHGSWLSRVVMGAAMIVLGRTADQGSRNLLYAAVARQDSHGCYIGNCEIEDDRTPDWVTGTEGQKSQKRFGMTSWQSWTEWHLDVSSDLVKTCMCRLYQISNRGGVRMFCEILI